MTGDTTVTVQIASALTVAGGLNETIRYSRPGPAWPDEKIRRATVAFNLTGLAVVAVNVYVGSVGFLMVVMLFVLSRVGIRTGDQRHGADRTQQGQRTVEPHTAGTTRR